MSSRPRRFKLSELPDEECDEVLNSASDIESEVDYESSDNDSDPDYVPDPITAEVNDVIDNAIREMECGETSHAFIDSTFDMSAMKDMASSTINDVGAYVVLDNVDLVSSDDSPIVEEVEVPVEEEAQPSTSRTPFKTPKRPRSPLPTVEANGPSFNPGPGGFTGLSE